MPGARALFILCWRQEIVSNPDILALLSLISWYILKRRWEISGAHIHTVATFFYTETLLFYAEFFMRQICKKKTGSVWISNTVHNKKVRRQRKAVSWSVEPYSGVPFFGWNSGSISVDSTTVFVWKCESKHFREHFFSEQVVGHCSVAGAGAVSSFFDKLVPEPV